MTHNMTHETLHDTTEYMTHDMRLQKSIYTKHERGHMS